MPLPFVSLARLARARATGTANAPFVRLNRPRHLAAHALALCAAAVIHGVALADTGHPCTDTSNGNGLMPDEVTSAWLCDVDPPAEAIAVPTAPAPDGRSDARLMLIVGVSSGAGWLARGLHRE